MFFTWMEVLFIINFKDIFCGVICTIIMLSEMGHHLTRHGDGVKDVSFEVEDLDAIVKVRIEMIDL